MRAHIREQRRLVKGGLLIMNGIISNPWKPGV
jgi:hypothetical protein